MIPIIGAWFYSGLILLFIIFWPLMLPDVFSPLGVAVLIVNFSMLVFVGRSCSTCGCSYWRGLNIISASLMCGCANITLIYALPILAFVYVLTVIYAIIGIIKGRDVAGQKWEQLVLGFHRRGISE